jgi:outer membrane protein
VLTYEQGPIVKLHQLFIGVAALAGMAFAQTAAPGTKIALVHMQNAIVGTTDGKNAEKRLDDEFEPRKAKLEEQEKEIATLQAQLDKGGLSDADKDKLAADIDHKTLLFNMATENADGDLRAAQVKVLQDLAPKMIACITQYAKDHGYAMVFDISESETAKLYGNSTDITQEVIAAYEKKNRR